jgi:TolB-like protein
MLVQKYQSPAASVVNVETPQVVPARQATPGERSLAVLPLQNFSADTEDSFADAMTEALITDLSRIDDVRVLSRTSSMLYKKHNNKTLPAIARELGVDMILEGSVTKAEGRVRITAQLIDARSDEHIWADDYERPMRELLSVQAEVATAIARSVRSAIASGPRKAQKVALR